MGDDPLGGTQLSDPADFHVLVPCPACGRKTCHKMSTLRSNPTYKCPQCDRIIDIEVNTETETVRTAPRQQPCQAPESRGAN